MSVETTANPHRIAALEHGVKTSLQCPVLGAEMQLMFADGKDGMVGVQLAKHLLKHFEHPRIQEFLKGSPNFSPLPMKRQANEDGERGENPPKRARINHGIENRLAEDLEEGTGGSVNASSGGAFSA